MRNFAGFPGPAADRRRLGIALLAGVLLLAACGEEEAPPPEPIRPVKVITIAGGSDSQVREYPGTIKAAQTADMAFEVPGKIVEFVYKEGAHVDEGALLARLDPRDYQARVDAAEADYENTRVNFERAQKLFESGALAALERDRRRTSMMEADARLRTAKKALEDTELRAPFAGTMARKLVEDYENVIAKQPVLVLTDDSHLELKLNVPERDLSGEIEGRRVDVQTITAAVRPEVVITSMPDRRFPARFSEIATTADPETRTYEATAVFEPPPGISILPGMTAKLIAHIPERRAGRGGIRVPVTASAADANGQPYVWVVDPATNAVSKRPVTLGELVGSDVIVRNGIQNGDTIVISGVTQLREGLVVRPVEDR